MPDDLLALIDKHEGRGVVVDTNILLVYLIGLHDPDLIPRFKRTQTFSKEDHQLLVLLFARFRRIITTPGILTEVNSLAGQLAGDVKSSFFGTFQKQIMLLEEQHTASKDVCVHAQFAMCGLTDAAIMTIAAIGLLVLTDDFRLTGYLQKLAIDHINFNHIRFLSY